MTKTSIRRATASTYRRNWSENTFKCVFKLGAVWPRSPQQNVPLLGETLLKDFLENSEFESASCNQINYANVNTFEKHYIRRNTITKFAKKKECIFYLILPYMDNVISFVGLGALWVRQALF